MKSMLVLLAMMFMVSATASDPAIAQEGASTATTPSYTYISAADLQVGSQVKEMAGGNIRVVNAPGGNVGVGAIRRTKNGSAALHFNVTEVYQVTDGAATLVTGGTMVDPKPRAESGIKLEDGPGQSGTAIQGGVSQRIKAGDVVIIPAGVPHYLGNVEGSITYTVVRFDPNRFLTLH